MFEFCLNWIPKCRLEQRLSSQETFSLRTSLQLNSQVQSRTDARKVWVLPQLNSEVPSRTEVKLPRNVQFENLLQLNSQVGLQSRTDTRKVWEFCLNWIPKYRLEQRVRSPDTFSLRVVFQFNCSVGYSLEERVLNSLETFSLRTLLQLNSRV